MAYDAKVFSVLIASPSDVTEEREIAVRAIQEWNDLNSSGKQIVLLPIRWETHTTPEYGNRPQEIINKQIVDQADLLIGIFWTRLGSPTGIKDSGTLEEIDRVAASNKPVLLYFSKKNKDPDDIDTDQLLKLREFKKRTYPNALVETFSNQIEFKEKLSKNIERQLRNLISSGVFSNVGKIESEISIEFFDILNSYKIGTSITKNTSYLDVYDGEEVPDYLPDVTEDDFLRRSSTLLFSSNTPNKDYYREMLNLNVANELFFPMDFWLSNTGALGAKDLYVSIDVISENKDIEILGGNKFNKDLPSKNTNDYLRKISINRSEDEFLTINKISDGFWNISFDLYALQPKRELSLNNSFFIGSKTSCRIDFEAKIFADSLPFPINQKLSIDLTVVTKRVSYKEIIDI